MKYFSVAIIIFSMAWYMSLTLILNHYWPLRNMDGHTPEYNRARHFFTFSTTAIPALIFWLYSQCKTGKVELFLMTIFLGMYTSDSIEWFIKVFIDRKYDTSGPTGWDVVSFLGFLLFAIYKLKNNKCVRPGKN